MSSSTAKGSWTNAPRGSINSAAPEDSIGRFFGNMGYTFGRTLGEGSYCKVRLAMKGNKKFAVKIISRQHQSHDFIEKFLPREIDILKKIHHRNIVKVFDIIDLKTHVFIFMEAVERGDMLDFIRGNGRLSERAAHGYFVQLISAVQYLHSINICHRDLKCENILLTDRDEIKIIDFGFCKTCVDESGKRMLSETYCGSTAYASPEVLMGNPYNPMMYDVWSLGCVLFIMVSGAMPFDDSNVKEMVRCQLRRRIRFPGGNLLSHDVKQLIRHMLEPDVTKRATVDQIAKCRWFLALTDRSHHSPSSKTERF